MRSGAGLTLRGGRVFQRGEGEDMVVEQGGPD
jgi:hypothetical protein